MRIQTRLFLGTALLVLVLTATQWSLHRRQLVAIERELSAVATAVGKGILDDEVRVVAQRPGLDENAPALMWIGKGDPPMGEGTNAAAPNAELEAVVSVRSGDLPEEILAPAAAGAGGPFRLPGGGLDWEAMERGLLEQALARAGGNRAAASRLLGLSYKQFLYRLAKHGIAAAEERPRAGRVLPK